MVVDRATRHGGAASATIRCKADHPANGFGTLMQTFRADQYRGKRLRLTGFVKANDVANPAGLWVRVDGTEKATSPGDDGPVFPPVISAEIGAPTRPRSAVEMPAW